MGLTWINGCTSPSGEGLVKSLSHIFVLGSQGPSSGGPGLFSRRLDLKPCSGLEIGQRIMTCIDPQALVSFDSVEQAVSLLAARPASPQGRRVLLTIPIALRVGPAQPWL